MKKEDVTKNKVENMVEALTGESYLLVLSNAKGPIVSIEEDGTVNVHQKGKNEEAAELFYDTLESYFKNQVEEFGSIERKSK